MTTEYDNEFDYDLKEIISYEEKYYDGSSN